MKVLFVGDLHITNYNKDKLIDGDTPTRLYYLRKNLQLFEKVYYENDCEQIVFLGDIFNDKSLIHSSGLTELVDFFERNLNIPIVIVQGNHDSTDYKNPDKSLLNIFRTYENVTIVYDYLVQDNVVYLGYKRQSEQLVEILRDEVFPDHPEVDTLVAHMDIKEGRLSNEMKLNKGLSFKKHLTQRFKMVISGHIHKPQILEHENSTLIYVGSVMQINWGERNEDKHIMVYDTKTYTYDFIPTHYQKHIVLKTEEFKNVEELKDKIQTLQKSVDDPKDIDIRIVAENTVEDLSSIAEDVENTSIVVRDVKTEEREIKIDVNDTLVEKINKWLDAKKFEEEHKKEFIDILTKYNII